MAATVSENPFAEDDEFRVPGVWTPDEAAAGQQYVTRKEFAQYVAALNQHGVMAANSTEDAPHPDMKVRTVGFSRGRGLLNNNGLVFTDGFSGGLWWYETDAPPPATNQYPRAFLLGSATEETQVLLESDFASGKRAYLSVYTDTAGGTVTLQVTHSGGVPSGLLPSVQLRADGTDYDFRIADLPLLLQGVTSDFADLIDGMLWYRSDLDKFRAQINNVTYNLAVEAGPQILGSFSELTIASGVITVTTSAHTVDTESDAASDDLDSISGGTTGQILVLRAANGGRTVNLIDGLPLRLNGNFALDNAEDTITLICQGSTWYEIARSDNGA